jgi:hypothetical protein
MTLRESLNASAWDLAGQFDPLNTTHTDSEKMTWPSLQAYRIAQRIEKLSKIDENYKILQKTLDPSES